MAGTPNLHFSHEYAEHANVHTSQCAKFGGSAGPAHVLPRPTLPSHTHTRTSHIPCTIGPRSSSSAAPARSACTSWPSAKPARRRLMQCWLPIRRGVSCT
eukprot:33273-Chlamydomonas_euryale.AAC.1